jgi:PKD domain/Fibronectin type III domain
MRPPRVPFLGATAAVFVVALLAGTSLASGAGVGPGSSSAGGSATGASTSPAASDLTAPGVTPSAISLSWPESTSLVFENYAVEDSQTGSGGPWTTVATESNAGTTTLAVTDLEPGSTYWWMVVTTVLLGGSSDSNVLEVTQPAIAVLSVTAKSSTFVNLSWTNGASYGGLLAFDEYSLVQSQASGTPTVRTFTNEAVLSFNVTGLAAGTNYSFYLNTSDCDADCGTGSASLLVTQSNVVTTGTVGPLLESLVANRMVIDVGESDLFTCAPTGGESPYTFAWNFTAVGGTLTAGMGSESYEYASAATYAVTCKVTDDASDTQISTIQVTVNPDPVLTVSIRPTTVTTGNPVSFRCAASSGTAPYTYVEWVFGDGGTLVNLSGSSNGTHIYPSAGQYVAHCDAEDAAGEVVSYSQLVHVNPPSAFAWLTPGVILLLSAFVAIAFALAVVSLRRRTELEDASAALARWIPPSGPRTAVRGSGICPACGASNTPGRRSCHVCGAPLR